MQTTNPEKMLDNQQYFYRTVIFTRKDNNVALADIYNPDNTSPVDPWFAIVISLADGKHTKQEFINLMKSKYPQTPAKLQETIDSVFERLAESKLVKMSDTPVQLPYYLAEPIENLDIEKAKIRIEEDGYTHH